MCQSLLQVKYSSNMPFLTRLCYHVRLVDINVTDLQCFGFYDCQIAELMSLILNKNILTGKIWAMNFLQIR